ncbi:multiple sugar transport system substrate-binding protein [Agromyces flavus]|uniref:Multiple sugar transport system substrate-binding protein n=1 Tax=Agromyces flavus TaxID=589382 RepID=A0A1H1Y146_9MICO|nr:extracellular solute-binding protein [Agromyces flavus]MCP2366559.1 multiple sugar transport system substrate-binding protein [Agromyces flavus]GGI44916.1 sugar ABC transporter substrate-binding protein [Agromyces flavus]SDT15105.1 multiple sugar transport system substrate-binding protein [Agromyces flavus]
MRFGHRALAATALVGSAGLLLGGCAVGTGGQAGETDAEYDPDADLSGTLSVMGFSADTDEVSSTRAEMAEAELGDVELELIEGELDIQQFLSSVASGEPPSLLYASRNQIGSLAARGAIIPLEDCIDGEGIETGDIVESALDQVTLDGTIYGIPEFNTVQVTMANADLLDAAGVSIEDVNGSDREAMTEAAGKLVQSEGDNVSVIGFDSKLPEFLPLWVQAAGGSILSDDGRTAQLDSDEAVEALEWAAGIYDEQGGWPAIKATRDSADFFGSGNQFATNTLGAMPMEQWYINVLNEVSADAPMAFDTVRTTGGEPTAYATGQAWAIPSGSDNPEAACRWARVMTSIDAWRAAAQARLDAREAEGLTFTGILTGNTVADEEIQGMTTADEEPWASAVAAMYEANENTFSLPANPADAEFQDAMFDAVNSVLNGEAEPADALAKAQEAAQAALDDGWAELEGGE